MKTKIAVCLWIVLLPATLRAEADKPAADAVVVGVMEAAMPGDEDERGRFLWDAFANKPEEQKFAVHGTGKWREQYPQFAGSLVRKAGKQQLDAESLRKVLDLVLETAKGRMAYLPVGAYQTTLEGSPVWIIVVKWAYPAQEKEVGFGHICMFAFDQKTLKKVASNSCR